MISLEAEPPSGRTMSPCRRIRVIRKPGWLGEQGIPVKKGWPSSISRTPPRTAARRGSVVAVDVSSVVMSGLLDGDRWLEQGSSAGTGAIEHDAGTGHD